jgi:hypothetical protein
MRLGRTVPAVLAAAAVLASPARSEVVQLPNLVAVPAFDLQIGPADVGPAPSVLRFSVGVANRGEWPFDLLGIPEDAAAQTASANQCTAWLPPRVCTARTRVGTFRWHPAHGHYHLDGFALYELRTLTPAGEPDMSQAGLVATSGKVSFCLEDYQRDRGEPATIDNPPFYRLCGIGSQGVSPRWMDTYRYGLAGQQIVVAGVPDGTYALVVTVDPDAKLLETDRTDDVSVAKLVLSGNGTSVRAL